MLRKQSGPLVHVLEAIGALCLVVLMVTVFVDVAGRNLFNKPLPWGMEVLEIVLAAMIFLIYPVLAASFGHITVDLIPVRPRLQKLQRQLGAVMGAALFGLIAWCLVRQALRAAEYGESTALLGVPVAWILTSMSVLAACTFLAFISTLVPTAGPQDTRNSIARELEAL